MDAAASRLSVVFEARRRVLAPSAGEIRASRLRLNGSTLDPSFTYRYRISPYRFGLMANFPDLFNPETWIPFELAEASHVELRIYAIDGRVVRSLDLGIREMGAYTGRAAAAYWDGRNDVGEPMASGVYIYELRAGEERAARRMVLMK
jgi:hypothetical protein